MQRRMPGSGGLLAAILAAGAVLRFATLATQSFWLDEAIAINLARLDNGGEDVSRAHTGGHAPLPLPQGRLPAALLPAPRRLNARVRRLGGGGAVAFRAYRHGDDRARVR